MPLRKLQPLLICPSTLGMAATAILFLYRNNDGADWPRAITIYPGASGYSKLAVHSNGDILLLY